MMRLVCVTQSHEASLNLYTQSFCPLNVVLSRAIKFLMRADIANLSAFHVHKIAGKIIVKRTVLLMEGVGKSIYYAFN